MEYLDESYKLFHKQTSMHQAATNHLNYFTNT